MQESSRNIVCIFEIILCDTIYHYIAANKVFQNKKLLFIIFIKVVNRPTKNTNNLFSFKKYFIRIAILIVICFVLANIRNIYFVSTFWTYPLQIYDNLIIYLDFVSFFYLQKRKLLKLCTRFILKNHLTAIYPYICAENSSTGFTSIHRGFCKML